MDLERLTEDSLAPIYILVSAEPLLIDRAVDRIRDLAAPGATRAFNYDIIQGKGATAAQILNVAQTLPMMAARRLVEVRDFGAVKAAELAGLLPYIADPNPTTTLLCVAEKVDKRIKFFQTIKKKGFLVELDPPKNDRGLIAWVKQEATRLKIAIAPRAVSRLVDVVGKDLARLSLSLEQLSLYAGSTDLADNAGQGTKTAGKKIDVEHVEDLIAETRERSVFELTDAIGDGDRVRALTALASLFDQRQSAIGVVIMLARHMRQLSATHEAVRARLPRRELPGAIGAPPFVVDRLMGQARRFPATAVDRSLCLLAEADFALKGGRPMTKTLGRELGDRIIIDRVVGQMLDMHQGASPS